MENIFEANVGTLEEASFDSEHKNAMTNSRIKVCLFDQVKEWYVKNKIPFSNPNPKSNDALFCSEEKSFFIEFKNGKIDNRVNFEINKKIYDSLFILFDLNYVNKNSEQIKSISDTREKMEYILVYNENEYETVGETTLTKEGISRQKRSSNNRNLLYKTVRGLAKQELILFGLDQFKNYLFYDVHTYTEKEFEANFVKKYEI